MLTGNTAGTQSPAAGECVDKDAGLHVSCPEDADLPEYRIQLDEVVGIECRSRHVDKLEKETHVIEGEGDTLRREGLGHYRSTLSAIKYIHK